jgi:hypothetical protein
MADPTIRELITKIENNIIQLPVFQRAFVWDGNKVQKFVESLYKGYPTGSFLMWTVTKKNKEIQFLVDGQQRLTSIMWALDMKKPAFHRGRELNFELMFNPVKQEFRRTIGKNTDNFEHWISVPEFFRKGMDSYIDKFYEMEDIDNKAILKNLNKLAAIEKYTYHIEPIPAEADIKEAVTIFNLVNAQGKTLNDGELAFASISVIWDGFKEIFEDFQKKIENKGFKLNVYFYMRLLSVINGYNAVINNKFHEQTLNEVKNGWAKVEKILPYLLDVLRDNLNIYKTNEFASQNPLYVMSVFLSKQKKYKFNSQKEINKWMYWYLRAIQHQRYSGSGGDNKIDIDVKIVRSPKYDKPIERLVLNIKETKGILDLSSDEVMGARSSISNNVYNLYTLMLREKGAIDWKTGTKFFPINQKETPKTHDHHIFPVARKLEVMNAGQDVYRYDTLANRVIVLPETNQSFGKDLPLEYLPNVAKNFPNALRQQFVPIEPKYYDTAKFNEFLLKRAKDIAEAINEFITKKSENLDLTSSSFDFENPPIESATHEYKTTFLHHYEDDEDKNRKKGTADKGIQDSVYKVLTAFANKDGGTLIIGMNEEDGLVGVEFDINNRKHIGNMADPFENYLNLIYEGIQNNVIRDDSSDNGVNEPIYITDETTGKKIVFISVDPVLEYPPVTFNTEIYVRRVSKNERFIKIEKDKNRNDISVPDNTAKAVWIKKRFKKN